MNGRALNNLFTRPQSDRGHDLQIEPPYQTNDGLCVACKRCRVSVEFTPRYIEQHNLSEGDMLRLAAEGKSVLNGPCAGERV